MNHPKIISEKNKSKIKFLAYLTDSGPDNFSLEPNDFFVLELVYSTRNCIGQRIDIIKTDNDLVYQGVWPLNEFNGPINEVSDIG
jgi:hypothetical protein